TVNLESSEGLCPDERTRHVHVSGRRCHVRPCAGRLSWRRGARALTRSDSRRQPRLRQTPEAEQQRRNEKLVMTRETVSARPRPWRTKNGREFPPRLE